jgi:hypothetical protein
VIIDAAPGGTIVLTGLAILGIVFVTKRLRAMAKKK